MAKYMRFAPWINRLVLAAAMIIFMTIGLRYITDPVGASAATGVSLHGRLAISTTRIGFGAFPLSFALFALFCLLSDRRLRAGVRMVATVLANVIVVRLISTATDGAAPGSVRLLLPETAILLLSIGGLVMGGSKPKLAKGDVA